MHQHPQHGACSTPPLRTRRFKPAGAAAPNDRALTAPSAARRAIARPAKPLHAHARPLHAHRFGLFGHLLFELFVEHEPLLLGGGEALLELGVLGNGI